jgi:hypothetical protein
MPLRARVGRHTRGGGRNCQNWPDDQQTVIGLLTRVPGPAGGAGSLSAKVVSGICSDELYRAISTFEDKHFPGQRSGYVDPAGAMLKRMEALTAAAAPAQGPIDFVTPTEEYGAPTGPTTVISKSTRPFLSNRMLYVGVAGDSGNIVTTISTDVQFAVVIEDVSTPGAAIHWYRLARPRAAKFNLQAKDANGTVLASVELSVIELPGGQGTTDFVVDPSNPNQLIMVTPKDDDDYIDKRMTAIGYNLYLRGFQAYCTGMNLPIDVPNTLMDLNVTKAEAIDTTVYDTLDKANEAIRQAPPRVQGVTPFAYYRGAGGAVIAPTIFSPATTPRIIATYYEARRLYAESVQHDLVGVAIGIITGMAVRALLGRIYRAQPGEPDPPPGAPPPVLRPKVRPVNDTVNVGGGGEIPNCTNLNPVKPGSGGPTSGIPNHVKGGMEDMADLFEPGSVKTMYSSRLRYGDVDWPKATQAAAKVMPPGGKVQMNVWTGSQEDLAALQGAFQKAGFKSVRIWGPAPGPGTMLDAVR